MPGASDNVKEIGANNSEIILTLGIDPTMLIDDVTQKEFVLSTEAASFIANKHMEMSLPKEAVEDDIADRKIKDLSDSEIGLDKLEKEEVLSEDEKDGHPEKHEKVDCECVNGECKPGQSMCTTCHKGW
jgi:hypothetical protein